MKLIKHNDCNLYFYCSYNYAIFPRPYFVLRQSFVLMKIYNLYVEYYVPIEDFEYNFK